MAPNFPSCTNSWTPLPWGGAETHAPCGFPERRSPEGENALLHLSCTSGKAPATQRLQDNCSLWANWQVPEQNKSWSEKEKQRRERGEVESGRGVSGRGWWVAVRQDRDPSAVSAFALGGPEFMGLMSRSTQVHSLGLPKTSLLPHSSHFI